ncbi:MAG: NusA-like transcription termination signal-binding factor [Aigarchaeota archaeon]|nr:NusA-like transcription termination signal-binding factor [Aigarchaeota archaeon]MDW8092996.1 NusA-like transcription termination signal-binding factor [Nitrososphaerota archaeon]
MSEQEIKMTDKELRYIALFSTITGADVVDCVETDNYLVFVVSKGHLTKALGKGGSKTKNLANLFKKRIKIIEYSDDVVEFVTNALRPVRVEEVKLAQRDDGKVIVVARVHPEEKGKTIGKGGKNITALKAIINRHHRLDSIIIE